MTRITNEPFTAAEPGRPEHERAPEGLSDDPLHHAPKPADVGLGPEGEPARREPAAAPGRATDQRSVADLIKELRDETIALFQQEVRLAKTELHEKVSFLGAQAGKLGGGLAVLGIGALMLLAAVAYFVGAIFQAFLEINTPTALGIGFTIVGAIAAIVGYALYKGARSKIDREPLTPERTIQSLKDDKQWLTNKTDQTH